MILSITATSSNFPVPAIPFTRSNSRRHFFDVNPGGGCWHSGKACRLTLRCAGQMSEATERAGRDAEDEVWTPISVHIRHRQSTDFFGHQHSAPIRHQRFKLPLAVAQQHKARAAIHPAHQRSRTEIVLTDHEVQPTVAVYIQQGQVAGGCYLSQRWEWFKPESFLLV